MHARLSEALGLDRDHVDLHNCMIRVRGKGNRERLVPISLECRKRLYLLLKNAAADPVFATSSGLRVTPRNAYRAIRHVAVWRAFAAGTSTRTHCGIASPSLHPTRRRHLPTVTAARPRVDRAHTAILALDGRGRHQRRASAVLAAYSLADVTATKAEPTVIARHLYRPNSYPAHTAASPPTIWSTTFANAAAGECVRVSMNVSSPNDRDPDAASNGWNFTSKHTSTAHIEARPHGGV